VCSHPKNIETNGKITNKVVFKYPFGTSMLHILVINLCINIFSKNKCPRVAVLNLILNILLKNGLVLEDGPGCYFVLLKNGPRLYP